MNFGQMSKCLCSLQERVTELELNGGGGGGGAAINFEGEWTSLGDGFAYEVGDVVIYDIPGDGFGANTYYCTVAHSSNIAVTPDIDASWSMIASGGADGAAGASADSSYHGFIESPTDKTYTIVLYSNRAGTISDLVTKTVSGTLTAKVQINGVDVTGLTGIAVTSSELSTAASAANAFVVGDTISLIISASSSPVDFQFSLLA